MANRVGRGPSPCCASSTLRTSVDGSGRRHSSPTSNGELLHNDALVWTALWVIVAVFALIAFLALIARPEVALLLGMVLGAPGLIGTVGLLVAEHMSDFDTPGWATWPFVAMAAAGLGLLAIGVTFSQRVG